MVCALQISACMLSALTIWTLHLCAAAAARTASAPIFDTDFPSSPFKLCTFANLNRLFTSLERLTPVPSPPREPCLAVWVRLFLNKSAQISDYLHVIVNRHVILWNSDRAVECDYFHTVFIYSLQKNNRLEMQVWLIHSNPKKYAWCRVFRSIWIWKNWRQKERELFVYHLTGAEMINWLCDLINLQKDEKCNDSGLF